MTEPCSPLRWSSAPAMPPVARSRGVSRAAATPSAPPAAAWTSCSRWWSRSGAKAARPTASSSDARKEEEVVALVEQIESTIGPIEVLVFNIGANVPSSILEETARKYFKIWEMACLGGFLNGREVAKRMVARDGEGHKGTIIFTGATASLRGSANFAAFAGAKHALRALAQSMARELGPRDIHVAHAIIDGAIDTEFIRENFPERYALKEQRRHPQPGSHRRELLDAAQAAARRVDPRAGPATLEREILMTKTVEFYFDVGSPAAYLAWNADPQLCQETALRSTTSRCCSAACSRPPATTHR